MKGVQHPSISGSIINLSPQLYLQE